MSIGFFTTRLSKLKLILSLILLPTVFLSSSCLTQPKPIVKIVYRDRVKEVCHLPKLSPPPKSFPVNVFKVKLDNKIYYCYDSDSATIVSDYLIELYNYANTCYLILQGGYDGESNSNGTVDSK